MGKCQEVLVSSQLVLKIKVHYSLLNSQKNKRKNSLELKTINCPNCGAINELNKYSKVKCEYCGTIIEDNK